MPIMFQRIEGGFILAACAVVYLLIRGDPWIFALLFFSFDISILGYLVNAKVGAISYNTVHSFIGPTVLFMIGLLTSSDKAIYFTLIWLAHLGFDRMIGFGMMYPDEFGNSHLAKKKLPAGIRRLLKRA